MKTTAVVLIILAGLLPARALHGREIMDPDTMMIGLKLKYDYITHKIGDRWRITNPSALGYTYAAKSSSAPANSWQNTHGETLYLDFGFRPSREFAATMTFEAVGEYADRYWQSVNNEHRMAIEGRKFAWIRGDVSYTRDDWNVRYFKGVGHYHWGYEGDMFNLYPEQYEPDRYLRISGRTVPEGFEMNIKGDDSKLTLLYGPELVWGYSDAVYAKYNFTAGKAAAALVFRNTELPYCEPDERMVSAEMSVNLARYNVPLEVGVLYQPFRLDRRYDYVQEEAPGLGTLGSSFTRRSAVTSQADAFGYTARLKLKPRPVLKEAVITATYDGILAGNKQEAGMLLTRSFARSLLGSAGYTYRKPVVGPMPLVFEGTPSLPGPALFEPRGMDSPFRVDWSNREASVLTFMVTFDPTPGTWFYRYQPDILDEWNLNPEENSKFSCALRCDLTRYFTGTDRLTYYDENGRLVWEPPFMPGVWPSNGYLAEFRFVGKAKLPRWNFLFDAGVGESPATGGVAYRTTTVKEKAITNYVTSSLAVLHAKNTLRLRYGQDIWGPEEWHRTFGETIDRLYQASLSRMITRSIEAGVEYTGVHEVDDRYISPETGDFDELRFFVTYSFGPAIVHFDKE